MDEDEQEFYQDELNEHEMNELARDREYDEPYDEDERDYDQRYEDD
jgi:hypothetical protein